MFPFSFNNIGICYNTHDCPMLLHKAVRKILHFYMYISTTLSYCPYVYLPVLLCGLFSSSCNVMWMWNSVVYFVKCTSV